MKLYVVDGKAQGGEKNYYLALADSREEAAAHYAKAINEERISTEYDCAASTEGIFATEIEISGKVGMQQYVTDPTGENKIRIIPTHVAEQWQGDGQPYDETPPFHLEDGLHLFSLDAKDSLDFETSYIFVASSADEAVRLYYDHIDPAGDVLVYQIDENIPRGVIDWGSLKLIVFDVDWCEVRNDGLQVSEGPS